MRLTFKAIFRCCAVIIHEDTIEAEDQLTACAVARVRYTEQHGTPLPSVSMECFECIPESDNEYADNKSRAAR